MTPKRVLFVSHDAGGTVPPMLAVAGALVGAGHTVTVLGQPSIGERAERAGSRFVPFTGIADYATGVTLEEQPELGLRVITGPAPGEDLLALVDGAGADVVVVDANLAGAAAAAETLGVPTAVLLHSMYRTFVDTWFAHYWPFMEAGINATRSAYGLAPVSSWPEVFAGHDRLVAVVPEPLDAPVAAPPPAMRHFGFLVPEPGATPPPARAVVPSGDDPLVLVSLSTTYQHQERLLHTIVDALGRLPVRALVTTGPAVAAHGLDPPANVVVERFVPHQLVLPDTAVVVTHGGLGTVAGALAHGVPLVCTPIDRDQPLNGERVAAVGAGITLGSSPTAAGVAAAVEAVLAEPRFRIAAEAMAAAAVAAGGPAAAAADLVAL